jgi:drug/metabolite transporter (DMT)-like permease
MRVEGERRSATPAAIWTALGAVYVIWGTTYLGIRVANETLPPLIAAGSGSGAGGVVPVAIRRGDRANDRPTRGHWRSAAIIGALLIAGGNGVVSPSGCAPASRR